jgi:cytochrome c5
MYKCLLFTAVLAAGSIAGVAQQKVVREVPAHMIPSLEGVDLYTEYCAVCHGAAGKGNGPAASALKRAPADLTQLSRKNRGKYPILAVKVSIKGANGIIEHGTGEMPMWGSVFSQQGQQKDLGDMRVMSLIKYIESLQAK